MTEEQMLLVLEAATDYSVNYRQYIFYYQTKEAMEEVLGMTFLMGLYPFAQGFIGNHSTPYYLAFKKADHYVEFKF